MIESLVHSWMSHQETDEQVSESTPDNVMAHHTAPPVEVVDPVTGKTVVMTKSAAKKIARRTKREQKKEATKHERRARERARRKERRKEVQAAKKTNPELVAVQQKPRPAPVVFNARVVVDLGFDDLMTEDEATSLASQLGYLYGVNRTSSHPFQEIVFTGAGRISGQTLGYSPPQGGANTFARASSGEASLYENRVGKHMETKSVGMWHRWKRVRLQEYGGLESIWQGMGGEPPICEQKDVVYLTADTDNTIDTLEPGKVYVIGGIVDRNRYKHLCAKKAEALGLSVARLPIDPSYLDGQKMQARKVLTVNQVFSILIGWTETRDWTAALKRGLPTRKFDTVIGNELEKDEVECSNQDDNESASIECGASLQRKHG